MIFVNIYTHTHTQYTYTVHNTRNDPYTPCSFRVFQSQGSLRGLEDFVNKCRPQFPMLSQTPMDRVINHLLIYNVLDFAVTETFRRLDTMVVGSRRLKSVWISQFLQGVVYVDGCGRSTTNSLLCPFKLV